jgi:hypothetical protein
MVNSSVPAHPSLTYDVDSVLRELNVPKSLVFPLSNIHRDTHGWTGKGVTRGRICAHCAAPRDPETQDCIEVPAADHYLTQLLEITADEPGWLHIAHPFDRDMPPTLRTRWDAARA